MQNLYKYYAGTSESRIDAALRAYEEKQYDSALTHINCANQ